MKNRLAMLLFAVIALAASGCAYQRAFIDYTEESADMPVRVDGWDGQRLGKVRAKQGGAIWTNCTTLAEGSIWVLMDKTRKLGGNAIGEIRWMPGLRDRITGDATCRQEWGWILLWPLLATPLHQTAVVEAYAYRIDDPEGADERVYLIPDSAAERVRLVRRILTDSIGSAGS
jgi:hypothetical protein